MRLVRYALVLLFAAFATPATAQVTERDPDLVPGQRARVTYQRLRRPMIGELVSFDRHEIVIRKAGVVQPYYITWDRVERLEASMHQYSRRETVGRGAIAGLLLGVVLGTSAIVLNEAVGSNQWMTRGEAREAAFEGLVLSTIGGAIFGFNWPRDSWQRVPLVGDPPRLTIRRLRDERFGFGLSFGD